MSLASVWTRHFLVMGVCFGTFVVSHLLEPYIEPLMACMVAGFVVINFSNERAKAQLELMKEDVAVIVHVAFFTLAGAALNLSSLSRTFLISGSLFLGRIAGIFLGAYLGGYLAGDPDKFNRYSWMTYITQAGVTLGLAKKVHLENRAWGGHFATIVIAGVVLNQIAGPPLFRLGLQLVGEANKAKQKSKVGSGKKGDDGDGGGWDDGMVRPLENAPLLGANGEEGREEEEGVHRDNDARGGRVARIPVRAADSDDDDDEEGDDDERDTGGDGGDNNLGKRRQRKKGVRVDGAPPHALLRGARPRVMIIREVEDAFAKGVEQQLDLIEISQLSVVLESAIFNDTNGINGSNGSNGGAGVNGYADQGGLGDRGGGNGAGIGSGDIVGGVRVLEGGEGEGSKEGDSLLGSSSSSSSNGDGLTGVPTAAAVAAAAPPAIAPLVDGADWDVDWEALTRVLGQFLECRVVVLMLRDDRRNALLCRAAAARAARAPRFTVFPRTFLCQSGGGGGGFGGGGRLGKGGVGGMLQGVAGRFREGLFIFPTSSTVRDIVERGPKTHFSAPNKVLGLDWERRAPEPRRRHRCSNHKERARKPRQRFTKRERSIKIRSTRLRFM